jgi:hypothetical protein
LRRVLSIDGDKSGMTEAADKTGLGVDIAGEPNHDLLH